MNKQKFEQIVESVARREVKYYKRRWNQLTENERLDCSYCVRITEPKTCQDCHREVRNQIWFIDLTPQQRRRFCSICKKTIKIPLKTGLDK